jgi:DNA polymerase-3 subunit chi
MTKVDFYILQSGSREHTACKLIEKAFGLGHRIYVHAGSEEQLEKMDNLLWTYRAGSFIPHQRYQDDSSTNSKNNSPVQLGTHDAPSVDSDVLINLAPEVPLFFSRFQRVAELVGPDEQARVLGRQNFQFYRDRGYSLNTHNL